MDITSKICINCNENKGFDHYHASKSGRYGYANACKQCRSKHRKQFNYKPQTTGTKFCIGCDNHKNVNQFYKDKTNTSGLQTYCKDCGTEKTKKWASTFDGFVKKLYKDTETNMKRRAKDLTFKITIEDIKELYKKQNGKCALTGNQMSFDCYMTKGNQHIINKWNMSIDRIDSSKGYELDNIQLVCAIINRMKTDLQDNEFVQICSMIVDHSRKN